MPVTWEQYEKKLDDPALCELLPVRDYLDNVLIRTSGAVVAGYELRGITSYFASDQERDRSKAKRPDALQAGVFRRRRPSSVAVASTRNLWRSLKACWLASRRLCKRQNSGRAG